MTIFSTPKAPGSSAKKQPMDYSSLAAPSPLPSKSLFSCLSGIDEEESSSESGSPCILLNSDDTGDKQVGGLQHMKSPTNKPQRRTTDSFLPVCSLQALSRSSKKILPRMSFSSPNIMRRKSTKRPQTEKAKKSSGSGSGGISQSNLTNVKLEMLNVLLDTKNEEVANLKSLLQQSEQKVSMLESKMISLEEELKQQQQVEPPSILEMSFGSNSSYNTDHDSQTMPYVPEEMLEDLTNQLKDRNQEIDALEDEVEVWQEQASEWKHKYQSLVEQIQNDTVSDEESVDTNDLVNFCNDCEEDNLEMSRAGEDTDTSNISLSVDHERDGPTSKLEETDGSADTDTNDISFSNDGSQSPLKRGSIESDDKMNYETTPVAKHSLRKRAPLGHSSLQNVKTTPVRNTKRHSRRRKKTKRYSPAADAASTNTANEENEISNALRTDDALGESAEFGEVGYKFKKYFGTRYGTYDGKVSEILPDGTRLCVYPADPNGDEYLTLEDLSKTKPLKQPRHDKVTTSRNDKGDADSLDLDERSDDNTDGILQVKKNVTCHICKNRRDLCVTFHCGKHSYCNNHCEKRLGFSATDVDPTKPPIIDYCPVCTLSCECSGCVRKKLSSKLRK
eukprot:scaffold7337_cov106-Skeletonema_marinoi.AAC.3